MSRPGLSRSPPGSPQGRGGVLPDRGGLASPTSPRSSFLGTFMRGRSRAASVTNAVAGAVRGRVGSPTVEAPNPMNALQDGGDVQRSQSTPNTTENHNIPPVDPEHRRTHRIRLVPVLETNRSFAFAPVLRDMAVMHVPPGVLPSIAAAAVTDPGPMVNGKPPPLLLKIGRFNDKALAAAPPATAPATSNATATASAPAGAAAGTAAAAAGPSGSTSGAAASTTNGAAGAPTNGAPQPTVPIGGGGGDTVSPKAGFRSKVVSRAHAEIWCEPGGKFFIRDTASSSGTFLNHIRLSSPNVQSRPQLLKDGDVLQLGVDYQGGAEEMYRCVKMRVEIGREWQRGATAFNTQALNQLKALGGDTHQVSEKPVASVPSGKKKRTFANLEEDVETEDAWEIASKRQSIISRHDSSHSLLLPTNGAPDIVTGIPGLAIGDSVASIDELLAASASNGSESEDSLSASPRPDFNRRDTAVAPVVPGTSGDQNGHTTPEIVSEQDELDNTPSHANATPMAIGHAHVNGNGSSRPSTENGVSTAASMAHTPMNDVFLSTLAITPSEQLAGDVSPADSTSALNSGANSSRLSAEIVEDPVAEAAAEREAEGDETAFVLD